MEDDLFCQLGGNYDIHQRALLSYSPGTRKSLLLFHSTGTGKTVSSLGIAAAILRDEPGDVYIFAPPGLLADPWRGELYREPSRLPQRDVAILRRAYESPDRTRLHFRTYHQMVGFEPARHAPFAVFFDEAHNFRFGTRTTRDLKEALRISEKATHRFLLTATPVFNRPGEAAGLYAMLTGDGQVRNLPAYYNCFEKAAAEEDNELIRRWWRCLVSFHQRPAEDPRFPRTTRLPVIQPMTAEDHELYNDAEEELLRNGDRDPYLTKLRQANNVPSKVTWLLWEHLPYIGVLDARGRPTRDPTRKVVIYSHWLETLDSLGSAFDQLGLAYQKVTGKTNRNGDRLAEYNNDNVQVLLISDAVREGHGLRATTSLVIWEPQWNREALRQVIGRVVRRDSHPHGRRSLVTVTELVWSRPPNFKHRPLTADERCYALSAQKDVAIHTFYSGLQLARLSPGNRCTGETPGNTFPVWQPERTQEQSRTPPPGKASFTALYEIKDTPLPNGRYSETTDRTLRGWATATSRVPTGGFRKGTSGKVPRSDQMPWITHPPTTLRLFRSLS